jgi:hypothetical protein
VPADHQPDALLEFCRRHRGNVKSIFLLNHPI